jgi:hypothetical protein
MKTIPIGNGLAAIVDDDDFEWLSRFKWCSGRHSDGKFIARRTLYLGKQPNGKFGYATILMHREILGVSDSKVEVDHINGVTLDNRRANLRPCTKEQNQWNRGKNRNNSTGHKGVFRNHGGFSARITANGKERCLGTFSTVEKAAKKYADASAELHGDFRHN